MRLKYGEVCFTQLVSSNNSTTGRQTNSSCSDLVSELFKEAVAFRNKLAPLYSSGTKQQLKTRGSTRGRAHAVEPRDEETEIQAAPGKPVCDLASDFGT